MRTSRAMTVFFAALVALLLGLGHDVQAQGGKRVALVVGINNYPKLKTPSEPLRGQLVKAVADAEAMREALTQLGFDVELVRNVDRTDFLTAIDRIKRKLSPGDTFFFYYAGHGVAFRGSNLLLPSDVPPVDPEAEQLIRGLSIAETDIIEAAREKGVALSILTLDACRNNPIEDFAREQARIQGRPFRSVGSMRSTGLEARPTSGVFSIYSAGIGQEALDRLNDTEAERNSVFTRVFIRKLREPGRHLSDVMEDVKDEVSALALKVVDPKTGRPHRQFPAYYNETQGGRIYLAGHPTASNPSSPAASLVEPRPQPRQQPGRVPDPGPCATAESHWKSAEAINTKAAYEDHLTRFAQCDFAGLARSRLASFSPVNVTQDDASATICNRPGSLWDLDGSVVHLLGTHDNPSRRFHYCQPTASMRGAGIRPGHLLFDGRRTDVRSYTGTIYIYAGRCGQFAYSVAGQVTNGDRTVIITGREPQIDQTTCRVTGYRDSRLEFSYQRRIN